MAALAITVEAYSGYRNDEHPRRFRLGRRWFEVHEILDRWLSPEQRYFKVRADDGCIYILCHDEQQGWSLHLFDSGTRAETRLSST
ncbi:hypothetical protein [Aquisalimonas sp.]|uniref:hypothetical protein n=1 Tax=Aquisalimonas sp. TaxID=1872621 RepID=UPI0025C21C5D|nr:hypothetical protein [Aquisalimonas sp.]